MAFEGMDPETIRAIAGKLQTQAAQLQGAMAGCDSALQKAASSWRGGDASRFQSSWSGSHRPALESAHNALAAMSTTLLRQVQEQTTASDDATGTVSVGGGPGAGPGGGPVGGGSAQSNNPFGGVFGPGGILGNHSSSGGTGGYLGLDGKWHTGATGTEADPAHGIQGVGYQASGSASSGSGDGRGGSGYHAGAEGQVFAGGNLSASQSANIGGVHAAANEQLTDGVSASGHAGLGGGPNGVYAGLGGAAMAGAVGTLNGSLSYGGVTASEQIQGKAGAGADGVASVSVGKNGIETNTGFDVMAGAGVSGSQTVSGGGVTVGGGASVGVGFGADAGADNTFGPHDIGSTGHIGLAFIGKVGFSWNVHIDPTKVAGEAAQVYDNVSTTADHVVSDLGDVASTTVDNLGHAASSTLHSVTHLGGLIP